MKGPHGVYMHPKAEVGYVPLLGLNLVASFFAKAGKMTKLKDFTPPKEVVGPRHMAINKAGTFAYLTGETSGTVTALKMFVPNRHQLHFAYNILTLTNLSVTHALPS